MPNLVSKLHFVCVIAMAISGPFAQAASRTAYFNQTGQNKTVNGLASPGGQSSCRITVSNPSGQDQRFTLTVSVNSIDSWGSGTSACASATAQTSGTVTGGTASCAGGSSTTLATNASITFTFNYSAYPHRSTLTAGTQKLRCSGSIAADDVSQPGFLVASGVLVTFVESTKMSTDGVTSGGSPTATEFGGMAVYTQVPITINRGKPF